jgi:ABC-type transport system involved in multi-copper enzyme maturation permease subunit
MNINPVLLKELRQRFRNIKSPMLVALYLLVIGALVLGYIYLRWRQSPGYYRPGTSREIFILLSMAQLGLIGFVTPGLTAGAISGERERQTLNVLLTTKLSTWGIVISKMLSSISFMVLLVLATLPLYNIVFLYGGIAPTQVLGVFGFYMVTVYLFAAVGVACSTYFKRTGISTVTTYGLVFALGVGTVLLGGFIYEVTRGPYPTPTPLISLLLMDINPVMVMLQVLGENAVGMERDIWLPYWSIYLIFYLVVGTLLLFWSGRRLNPARSRGAKFRL